MKLGLVTEFDAAHSLPGYQGKCAHLHGHTYQVEVVVEGQVGADGFVMDFYQLKKVIAEAMKDLDHAYLNDILPNPTAETIAQHLAGQLKEELEGTSTTLCSLKLWEGKNKWVLIE